MRQKGLLIRGSEAVQETDRKSSPAEIGCAGDTCSSIVKEGILMDDR